MFTLLPELYESRLEPAQAPEIPSRSRLYTLPIIGAGTAAVESITSYLARLALAHAVNTWTLLKHEIARPLFGNEANLRNRLSELVSDMGAALNGENGTSQKFIALLSELTGHKNLAQGTMSFCEGSISPRKLIRCKQAWCRDCLNEAQHAGGELHYQLLWQVLCVKVCPKHRSPLQSQCPSCQKSFAPLTANTNPGFCPRCRAWLGDTSSMPGNDLDALDLQVASAVAELLAHGPMLAGTSTSFAKNIRQLVASHFSGNIAALARFLHVHRYSIISWISGTHRPSMEALARVSILVNVPMAVLITESLVPDRFNPLWDASSRIKTRLFPAPPIVDGETMRLALEKVAFAEHPTGISISAIAKKVGCNQSTLQRRFPELTELVKRRYLEGRKMKMQARAGEVRSLVKAQMLSLHNAGIYPSQAKLRAALWGRIDMREPCAHQTWQETLAELCPCTS